MCLYQNYRLRRCRHRCCRCSRCIQNTRCRQISRAPSAVVLGWICTECRPKTQILPHVVRATHLRNCDRIGRLHDRMESWSLIDVDGGACRFLFFCYGLLWGWSAGTRRGKGWQAKASLEDIPTSPRWYSTYLFLRRDIDPGAGKRGVYPYFI